MLAGRCTPLRVERGDHAEGGPASRDGCCWRSPPSRATAGLLVPVTHQMTISALSATFADSGTGVLMALGDGGRLEPIGTLAFGVAAE